jgi:hypothetical protein
VIPFNFLLIGSENLVFLVAPSRSMTPTPGDFQAIGRLMLLYLAKFVVLGLVGGVSALVAVPVYFLTGRSMPAALTTAWLVITGFAAGLVPLIALAFRRFDVAREIPP